VLVAGSTPAGTSRVPADCSPGAAEALPTVKRDCAWAMNGVKNRAATTQTRIRIRYLREGMEHSARRASRAIRRRKERGIATEARRNGENREAAEKGSQDGHTRSTKVRSATEKKIRRGAFFPCMQ